MAYVCSWLSLVCKSNPTLRCHLCRTDHHTPPPPYSRRQALSVLEMSQAMKKRGKGTPLAADLHAQMTLVKTLDKDGEGGIDESEFVDGMLEQLSAEPDGASSQWIAKEMAKAETNGLDDNGDGDDSREQRLLTALADSGADARAAARRDDHGAAGAARAAAEQERLAVEAAAAAAEEAERKAAEQAAHEKMLAALAEREAALAAREAALGDAAKRELANLAAANAAHVLGVAQRAVKAARAAADAAHHLFAKDAASHASDAHIMRRSAHALQRHARGRQSRQRLPGLKDQAARERAEAACLRALRAERRRVIREDRIRALVQASLRSKLVRDRDAAGAAAAASAASAPRNPPRSPGLRVASRGPGVTTPSRSFGAPLRSAARPGLIRSGQPRRSSPAASRAPLLPASRVTASPIAPPGLSGGRNSPGSTPPGLGSRSASPVAGASSAARTPSPSARRAVARMDAALAAVTVRAASASPAARRAAARVEAAESNRFVQRIHAQREAELALSPRASGASVARTHASRTLPIRTAVESPPQPPTREDRVRNRVLSARSKPRYSPPAGAVGRVVARVEDEEGSEFMPGPSDDVESSDYADDSDDHQQVFTGGYARQPPSVRVSRHGSISISFSPKKAGGLAANSQSPNHAALRGLLGS